MARSSVKYHPIPSSEDQGNPESGENNSTDSTSACFPIEARAGWTYFLLGCAVLLPWNALINATAFFLSRLVGSPLYQTFSSSMASVYTLTNLLFQFYCTVTSKQSSPSRRIFVSIVAGIILISCLCFSTFIQGTPPAFFSFTLLNTFLLALVTGSLCTAVYAGAALLGGSFLQTVLAGQAAIAVAVSAVQLVSAMISLSGPTLNTVVDITEGGGDQAEAMAARIFFGVSAVFLAVTLLAYLWLTRQPFYKSVTSVLEQHQRVAGPEELTRLVTSDDGSPSTGNYLDVLRVFKRNWVYLFSVMYVFAITLSVYPAITVRVRSVDPSIHPLLFTSVHFLVFNFGDLIGRYGCSFPCFVVWSDKKILTMALLRTVFIPLCLLCNVERPAGTIPVIGSDVLFMIIMLTMGYTNGHVQTLALLAVSSLEHNPGLQGRREDVDIAATLGAAFVNLGLAVGSLSSFGVQVFI